MDDLVCKEEVGKQEHMPHDHVMPPLEWMAQWCTHMVCHTHQPTNPYSIPQAFSIGLFQVVYTIEVRVQYQGTTDVLRLGPRNRLGVTSNRLVEAQLVGDFASFSENPSLQDHTLFIPAVRQGVGR